MFPSNIFLFFHSFSFSNFPSPSILSVFIFSVTLSDAFKQICYNSLTPSMLYDGRSIFLYYSTWDFNLSLNWLSDQRWYWPMILIVRMNVYKYIWMCVCACIMKNGRHGKNWWYISWIYRPHALWVIPLKWNKTKKVVQNRLFHHNYL